MTVDPRNVAGNDPATAAAARIAELERRLSVLERGPLTGGTRFAGTRYTLGDAPTNADILRIAKLAGGASDGALLEVAARGTDAWAELDLRSTRNAADAKVWNIASRGDQGVLAIRTVNDARTAADVRFQITRAGAAQFQTNVWHTDLDGRARMYFETTGITYLRGQGIVFRNQNDTSLGRWDANGTLVGDYGINANRATTGTPGWAEATFLAQAFVPSGFSNGQENSPRISFHRPSQATAPQIVAPGNNFYFVNSGDTATVAVYAQSYNIASDEAVKLNRRPVARGDVLTSLRKLTVERFDRPAHPKAGAEGELPAPPGIGPTAQDFHAAFPGLDGAQPPDGRPMTYSLNDAVGVLMAAVQALADRVDDLEARPGGPALPVR